MFLGNLTFSRFAPQRASRVRQLDVPGGLAPRRLVRSHDANLAFLPPLAEGSAIPCFPRILDASGPPRLASRGPIEGPEYLGNFNGHRAVLHGSRAVAPLKAVPRRRPRPRSPRPPRLASRGPIEGSRTRPTTSA